MVSVLTDYLKINKHAFDTLASEYNKRSTENIKHQEEFLKLFEKRLQNEFKGTIKVLDAGCGVGIDSLILSIKGFKVHGVDISSKMLSFAKKNAPFATFEEGNFLEKNTTTFHGVLMDAFIHLFPEKEIDILLKKTRSLLVPGGLVLTSTTASEHSREGYFVKDDYNFRVRRFRKFWTKEELIKSFEKHGFTLMDYYLDSQNRWNKKWMNFIFQKTSIKPNK